MPPVPYDTVRILASLSPDDFWDLIQMLEPSHAADQVCAICLCTLGMSSPGLYGHLDNCVHTFCASCLLGWSAARVQPAQRTCPVCRTIFGSILVWPRVIFGQEKERIFRMQNAPHQHVQRGGEQVTLRADDRQVVATILQQETVVPRQTDQQQTINQARIQLPDRRLAELVEQANILRQRLYDVSLILVHAQEQARVGGEETQLVFREALEGYIEARFNARQANQTLNQYRNQINQ